MRRSALIAIISVYVAIVLSMGFAYLNYNHLVFSEGYDRYEEKDELVYLSEQSGSSSVVYCGNYSGKIFTLIDLSTYDFHQKLLDMDLADTVYLLTSVKNGYQILRLNPNLKILEQSDIFAFDNTYQAMRLNVYGKTAYMTAIEEGNLAALVYEYSLEDLYPPEEAPEEEVDEASYEKISSTIRLESTEGLIHEAYYNGSRVVTGGNELDTQVTQAAEYQKRMHLTFGQSLKINRVVLVIDLIACIGGVIIIFIISNLIGKKKRFINQILIWTTFVIVGTICAIVVSGGLVFPIIWGVVLELFIVLYLLWENRDIRIICNDMKRISEDIYDIERPYSNSDEMQLLWRGMNELCYQFEKFKYIQDVSTVAALKFLPKRLENVFRRGYLEEIRPGDSVSISGTMMSFRTKEAIDDAIIKELEEYEYDTAGMMMVGNCEATQVKMFFADQKDSLVKGGMRFESRILDSKMCILYFDDTFKFAITGTATKSVVSVTSELSETMEDMLRWFKDHDLGMVITDGVKNRENIDIPTRRLGYVDVAGRQVYFYEVLDVYNEQIRSTRLRCQDAFNEALELYYEHDFYLARTAFSDILKIDTTDEISRWYLFMCERYLNDPSLDKVCCLVFDRQEP